MTSHDTHRGKAVGQHCFQLCFAGILMLTLLIKEMRMHVKQTRDKVFAIAINNDETFWGSDFPGRSYFRYHSIFNHDRLIAEGSFCMHWDQCYITNDIVVLGKR